jgi:hypothetical protein
MKIERHETGPRMSRSSNHTNRGVLQPRCYGQCDVKLIATAAPSQELLVIRRKMDLIKATQQHPLPGWASTR